MDDLTAVIDQPTEEVEVLDQPEEHTEHENLSENQDGQQAEKVDGRKFPSEWSKAMKELRELYPDKADMLTKLRDTYGRYGAVSELAPKGVEELRQWKTTIDALGGQEAAADMMQRMADVEQIDAKIEAGDYSVVSELPKEMQDGFYRMLPDALSDLAQKDPQAFGAAVTPHFQAALAGTGLGDALKEMYTAAGDNEAVKGLVQKVYDWYQRQTSGQGGLPQGQKTVDPQVQRLQSELSARQKADDDAFVSGVGDAANKYVAESFTKNAEVYLKQFNLTEAQKTDLMESFQAKMTDKLGADTAFQKQLAAYKTLKNRNPETVNSYVRSKVDENAKSIIDGLVTARYGSQKAKPTLVASKAATDGGAVRVTQAPDQAQWDMPKMEALGYEATVKKGLFYLQGGKAVQLVKQ